MAEDSGSAVSLESQKLKIGSRYLTMASSVSTTSRASSATTLTIYKSRVISPTPTLFIRVTNKLHQGYILPETGGTGVYLIYTVGGAMIAFSFIGCTIIRRKRRKTS